MKDEVKAYDIVRRRLDDMQQTTHKKSGPEVLNEDHTLELDDEEINQLLSIVQETLKRLLRDDKVLLRPHASCNAIAKHSLACDLCRSGDAEDDVEGLKRIANDIEISSGEDEEDGGGKGDAGCAWVLPLHNSVRRARIQAWIRGTYAQEAVEHRVIVYTMLSCVSQTKSRKVLRVKGCPVAAGSAGV